MLLRHARGRRLRRSRTSTEGVYVSFELEREEWRLLTRHSDRVSTILSPSTKPQFPHTRSPLPNSSTMLGLGSLHSGQMRRTARSGPNVGALGPFVGAARGNGWAYAISFQKSERSGEYCGRWQARDGSLELAVELFQGLNSGQ